MTKEDRAKMRDRVIAAIPCWISGPVLANLIRTISAEIDIAVRAERNAHRDTDELWSSHRQRADEQMIERAKGLGRKRT